MRSLLMTRNVKQSDLWARRCCGNCGDVGVVYAKFLAGIYKIVSQ